jgi:ABC-type glycerol-3-phosphate transport system substrate-binding protein
MGTSGPRGFSRRDFLKTSGVGLAGAVLLGATGCGGEQGGGATELYFTGPPDESGTTQKLISDFNEKNQGTSTRSSSARATRTRASAWTSSGPSFRLAGKTST